jgi:hypothetical protein
MRNNSLLAETDTGTGGSEPVPSGVLVKKGNYILDVDEGKTASRASVGRVTLKYLGGSA